jgi:integrase
MKRNGLPKWASEFEDRHGTWRIRFRRKGWKTAYPKARAGTDEFAEEYRRWLAGEHLQVGGYTVKAGTMRAIGAAYFGSLAFLSLKQSTQRVRRNIYDRFCEEAGKTGIKWGEMPFAGIQREHVQKLMAARAAKPESANGLRKVLRAVMQYAVEAGLRHDDPTQDVKAIRVKSEGFHSWTEDEIEKFETTHAVGTKARLAFALLLFTGQRRGDVIRMGRQHIRGGFLFVRQQKTGAELEIPVLAELQAILDATPNDHLTFLVTQQGKPFTAAGFGNWFRQVCDDAGLHHCSAHGLRKAASRRLADCGCTVHQVAAITGHASLREVQRYTKGADQKRLASAAMAKFKARTSDG